MYRRHDYMMRKIEREFLVEYSYRPIDCGFDPRAHGMECLIPHDADRVLYTDQLGEDRVATGNSNKILKALLDAGYNARWEVR